MELRARGRASASDRWHLVGDAVHQGVGSTTTLCVAEGVQVLRCIELHFQTRRERSQLGADAASLKGALRVPPSSGPCFTS